MRRGIVQYRSLGATTEERDFQRADVYFPSRTLLHAFLGIMPDPLTTSFSSTGASTHPSMANEPHQVPGEITALGFLNRVLRNRRLIAVLALAGFALMAILSLASPRTWTATGAFIPASRQAKSGLAALAAQYGVQMGADEPSTNPDFYGDLIRSRGILTQLALAKVEERSASGIRTVTISDRLKVTGDTPEMRTEHALAALRGTLHATVTLRTGMLSYAVTTRDAKLSEQIAAQVLELLNRFNVESRQQQAASERRFTEQRLAEVRVELRAAEDRMIEFQLRNRGQGLADVQFSSDRLQREIQRLHGLYTTLEQAYEQARIDEVRDTPLLTVIDRPVVPLIPDPRGTVTKSLLGAVLGGLLGVLIGIVHEQFGGSEDSAMLQSAQYREFAILKTETLADIRGFRHIFSRNNARFVDATSSSSHRADTSAKL